MPKLNFDELQTQKEVFEVRLNGKDYHLPLASDINYRQYEALVKAQESMDIKSMIDFLAQFMGKEIAETLPFDTIKFIFDKWGEASNGKTGDLSSGES